MDKESTKILTEADFIEAMIASDGWKLVKAKLDNRILDLQNINNLDMSDVNTLPAQLASRKMTADYLFSWLKEDIYGFIEQQRAVMERQTEGKTDMFIERE